MRTFASLCGSVCVLLVLAGWSAAQVTNFPVGPQYLFTPGSSPLFLHPIATPSLSLDSGLPPVPSDVTGLRAKADEQTVEAVSQVLDAQRQTFFPSIYYGLPQVSVVAIAFGEPVVSVPPSFSATGVVDFTSPQALGERGYGISVAEVAARWKTHTLRARRVYTNEDIERLRSRD
jgi:hypothetical protein